MMKKLEESALADAGYSKRAISKILYCSRITATKYLEGAFPFRVWTGKGIYIQEKKT